MLYRSYGLLLLMIAVLIMSQTYRDQLAVGLGIGGLILFVDLPLRLLGQIVPWRNDCVVHWYVSPYRGSHIFFIPTWLFGAIFLVLAGASFVSPHFENLIEKGAKFRLKDEKPAPRPINPPTPPSPPQQPKGKLEVKIETTPPFSNTTFRWNLVNRTGDRLSAVNVVVRYKGSFDPKSTSKVELGFVGPNEVRDGNIRVIGSPADWVSVAVSAVASDGSPVSAEGSWLVEKR